MIKVAIVEDEDSAANVLMGFLERYAAGISEKIIYVRYNCTTDFLSEYDGYDIVFMDINIANDMNGIKAAHKANLYEVLARSHLGLHDALHIQNTLYGTYGCSSKF